MRWLSVFFVLAHLFLRGAAVPHSHEGDAHSSEHAFRTHVHLTWHDSTHDHDDESSHHTGDGLQHDEAPGHGDDVVYLDGALDLVSPPKGDDLADGSAREGFAALAPHATVLMMARPQRPEAMRPPGEIADALQAFLPHVLRI
jgi:hypothetical protein